MIRKTIAFALLTVMLMTAFGIFIWILRQFLIGEDSVLVYWAAIALVLGWLLWWQAGRAWSTLNPQDTLIETELEAAMGASTAEASESQGNSTDMTIVPDLQAPLGPDPAAEATPTAMPTPAPEPLSSPSEAAPLEGAPIRAISPPEMMIEQFASAAEPSIAAAPHSEPISEPAPEPEYEPVFEAVFEPEVAAEAPVATPPPVAELTVAEQPDLGEQPSEPKAESDHVVSTDDSVMQSAIAEPKPELDSAPAVVSQQPVVGAQSSIGVPLTWTTWGKVLQAPDSEPPAPPRPAPASAPSPAANTTKIEPLTWTTWSAMRQTLPAPSPAPEVAEASIEPTPPSVDDETPS